MESSLYPSAEVYSGTEMCQLEVKDLILRIWAQIILKTQNWSLMCMTNKFEIGSQWRTMGGWRAVVVSRYNIQ